MKQFLATSAFVLVLVAGLLVGCAGAAPHAANYTSLEAYPKADMSGYACAADYNKEYQFRNMTVAEMVAEMDKGSTFVVYAGFNKCPWCNVMLNLLNDIAANRGIDIAYIDTRANPSWKSNMDIDDYDLLVERFGSVIPEDNEGKKHLYAPHCFFVKNGQLVHDHSGTVPSQAEPSDPLTEEEIDEYNSTINSYIDDMLR